jgi:chromosome segregation ATPase
LPAKEDNKIVKDMEKKLDKLITEVTELRGEVEKLSTSTSKLEDVEALNEQLKTMEKKVSNVEEIPDISKKLDLQETALHKKLDEMSGSIEKQQDALDSKVDSIKDDLSPLSTLEETNEKIGNVNDLVKEMSESKETDVIFKKLDEILISLTDVKDELDTSKGISEEQFGNLHDQLSELTSEEDIAEKLESIDSRIEEGRAEFEKKIEDLLGSVVGLGNTMNKLKDSSESDVIRKKIDSLETYIADLSGLEDRFHDLNTSIEDTKEIVGIIVRQLDDIERKYNKTLDKVDETIELVEEATDNLNTGSAKQKKKEETVSENENEEEVDEPKKDMPEDLDSLMQHLLDMVDADVEANEMAAAIESVRDQLTNIIDTHTPVLFKLGKRANELKSYPPTATLNENDIARLNSEIREWREKLTEISK